jgi:hypothetical protein
MEFDDLKQFHKVVEVIRPLTASLKIYGIYRNGMDKKN